MNKLFLSVFTILVLLFSVNATVAVDENELKEKINEHKSEIEKLDEEIKKYEQELSKVSKKKKTLSNLMRQIEISTKKINTSVVKTKTQIKQTSKTIEELEKEIANAKITLSIQKEALAKALQKLNTQDDYSLVELFLKNQKLSDIWSDIEAVRQFQATVNNKLKEVEQKRIELTDALAQKKKKKQELTSYQKRLIVQKRSLEISKQEKARILKQTQNKESEYQRILAEKRAARERFEKALREFESKLSYKKTGELPKKGSKVFSWPLDYIHITQYFGNTPFARSGAYNGRGHNGLDLGTPLGSPVKAPADGVVEAVGNTDAYPGCLSYGKWVLIKHDNGLATMYAHLSQIATKPGTKVKRGDVFAYSGSSGYSTGPHLHFGVYDASAVKVVRIGSFKKSRRCSQAKIPIAPWKAYFNPLDFLPSTR